jgi:hypothetical protein
VVCGSTDDDLGLDGGGKCDMAMLLVDASSNVLDIGGETNVSDIWVNGTRIDRGIEIQDLSRHMGHMKMVECW